MHVAFEAEQNQISSKFSMWNELWYISKFRKWWVPTDTWNYRKTSSTYRVDWLRSPRCRLENLGHCSDDDGQQRALRRVPLSPSHWLLAPKLQRADCTLHEATRKPKKPAMNNISIRLQTWLFNRCRTRDISTLPQVNARKVRVMKRMVNMLTINDLVLPPTSISGWYKLNGNMLTVW